MAFIKNVLNTFGLNDKDEDDELDDLNDFDDYGNDTEAFGDDADDYDDDFEENSKKTRFSKFKKRHEPEEDLDDVEDSIETKKTSKTEKAPKPEKTVTIKEPVRQRATQTSKITPMRSNRRNTQSYNMEVSIIKPTTMEDSRLIVDTLSNDIIVILNLIGLDEDLAQRIFDFASGASYAMDGRYREISNYIFVFAPHNVKIDGDFEEILATSIPSIRAGY